MISQHARWLSVLLIVPWIPAPAGAFRTLSDDDPAFSSSVKWSNPSVTIALYEQMPRDMLVTDAHRALWDAVSAWTAPACSLLNVPSVSVTSEQSVSGDGVLVVEVLRSQWRNRGFSSDVAATTDMIFELVDSGAVERWVIADADVLVNDLDYEWSASPQDPAAARRDLRSVLTHELGHGLVGLAHPCEHGVAGIPECSAMPALLETTMYPDYLGASQSSLSPDDIAGVCFVYADGGCADVRCEAAAVCIGGECRALCGTVVCLSGHTCAAGECAPTACVGDGCPMEPRDACGADDGMCGTAPPVSEKLSPLLIA